MSIDKKIGIMLIIIGFFIPSVLYPFTSYSPQKVLEKKADYGIFAFKYSPRLSDLEIILSGDVYDENKIALPYHYVVVIGIMFIFVGTSILALTGRKKEN
jgi:uncharacterized membrane protein